MTQTTPLDPPTPKLWSVGTLSYTRGQLVRVFTWLLLGDFCLHLMDNGVIPNLVPLQLESLGASKTMIQFINITCVNLMYCILVPIVSTWSDRHRGKLGRRRPFLLWATPPLALVLILLGSSIHLARFGQHALPGLLGGFSTAGIALTLTVTFFILFKFLDMFPQSVYYYMWPDVVPHHLLGMFGALFRVFYASGSLVFNYFLLQYAKTHPVQIYLGAALLYMTAFLLLVWRVKEGEYPPPKQSTDPSQSTMSARVSGYFRECFTNSFYWKFYLMNAAFQIGYQPFINNLIFFGKEIYGDNKEGLGRYGSVMALKDLIWIGIYLLLVPVMHRLHPLRAGLLGYVLLTLTSLVGYLTINDPRTFSVMTISTFVAAGVYLGGTAAIGPRLLPRDKYGQFASANALVFRLSVALSGIGVGIAMDMTHGNRVVFGWLFVFCAIGTAMMYWLYRDWKRLGGETDFQPPQTS